MEYKKIIAGKQKYIDIKLIKLINRIQKKQKCQSFKHASFILANSLRGVKFK